MSLTVEKCLQAWTNSLRQMNAKADIVFFGDSLTYYGDFSKAFPGKVVCNLGLRGDTIQGMLDRVEQIMLLEPQMVYLMAGINDVSNSTPQHFEITYKTLIQNIIYSVPMATLYIQSILPINDKYYSVSINNKQIRDYNQIIKKITNCINVPYLDVHSYLVEDNQLPADFTNDGIHLLPVAYNRWISILKRNYSNDTLCL